MRSSQALRLTPPLCHSSPRRQTGPNGPTTPTTQRLPAVTRDRFSLFRFRSPLLTESRLLSLPAGNEMFHFPTFPPHALCVQARVTGHDSCRVSPFGHPRITARLAAPRGLSQPPTSFIGSWCQGIHRAPLLTCPQRCSRPLCSSQETGGHRARSTPPARTAGRPDAEHGPATRPKTQPHPQTRTRPPDPAPPAHGRPPTRNRQSTGPSGPNSVPPDPHPPARPTDPPPPRRTSRLY